MERVAEDLSGRCFGMPITCYLKVLNNINIKSKNADPELSKTIFSVARKVWERSAEAAIEKLEGMT